MVKLEDIKTISVKGINFNYYTKNTKWKMYKTCYVLDDDYNCLREINIQNESDIIKDLEWYIEIKALKPTYKKIVYENCIHEDYFESTYNELYKNGIIAFPVQRGYSMKASFYNTYDYDFEVLKCLDCIRNKDIFKIKFKTNTLEYHMHSIQVSDKFKDILALCFVRKDIDINDFFEECKKEKLKKDYSENDEAVLERYMKSKKIIFVVSTDDVEDSMDALFDMNKHYIRGFRNKTIQIDCCIRQNKIKNVLTEEA